LSWGHQVCESDAEADHVSFHEQLDQPRSSSAANELDLAPKAAERA
jgi:hypothetical protein